MLPTKKHQSWLPSILNDFMSNEWIPKTSESSPAVNIIENDDNYKVEIAVPGMSKKDFNIEIANDNELVVTMEKNCNKEDKNCGCKDDKKKEPAKEGDKEVSTDEQKCCEDFLDDDTENTGRYLRREFFYSRFQQTLLLPDDVDKEKISAKEKNGILTIVIPKKISHITVNSSKKIEVK